MKINNLKKRNANIRKIELTYLAILCVFIIILGVVAVREASEYIGFKEIKAFNNGYEFGKLNCPIYLAN